MAEEENENEAEETEAESSGGGKGKLILIVLGLLVLLVLIGAPVAYFALSGEKPVQEESVGELPDDQMSIKDSMEGDSDEDEWDDDEDPIGAIFPLETFVVNLAGAKRFFRCQVQVEFFAREIPKRFYARLVPIRDDVIKVLTARTVTELSSVEGKEQLREDLKKRVNELLRKEEVKNIYFTQFVIQ